MAAPSSYILTRCLLSKFCWVFTLPLSPCRLPFMAVSHEVFLVAFEQCSELPLPSSVQTVTFAGVGLPRADMASAVERSNLAI